MAENTYFDFMISNLGYKFEDRLTLITVTKDVLHNLYQDKPQDIKLLTAGKHSRYRRAVKEDWVRTKYNNTEVMVCARKFVTEHGSVRLVDRSSEELRSEAKRTFLVLKENDQL